MSDGFAKPENCLLPRMYREFARWWPLLSLPSDYAEESSDFIRMFRSYPVIPVHDLLELGSGGGNNASHLKIHFSMTLVDLSADMIKVSSKLNPECVHVCADMRSVRLGKVFDSVFIHDAIAYIRSESDLKSTLLTAFLHCKPGGIVVIAPDFVKETFKPSTDHGGHDGPDCGMRFVEWTWDPDSSDCEYYADFAFLFRERDGSIHAECDRHKLGLFPRSTWISSLSEAGFTPKSETDQYQRDVFIGLKPIKDRS